jgi:endonuclease YncB( thermonuclease family)
MYLRLAHRLCNKFRRSGVLIGLPVAACLAFVLPALAGCGTPSGRVRVVDVGERFDLALEDGRIVRLGGLDMPNPSRGSPETARAARQFLAARVVGRETEIDLIASGMDRWGRVVADLTIPDSGAESIAIALLSAGHARVRPEFEARACASVRLAAEDRARRGGLGLWRDPAYSVVEASDANALRARDGQFIVIEGEVGRVGFGRSRLYLDLIPHDGPTVVIARKVALALARGGRPVEGLTGEVIRARGALDDRLHPRIEVNEPAMIEVVRGPTRQE